MSDTDVQSITDIQSITDTMTITEAPRDDTTRDVQAPKKKYRIPPAQSLINNQASNTNSWCRYDPVSCLAQVGIETLFLAAAYSSVLLLLGNEPPKITNVAKFMVMFSFLSFAARMISDTLSDKITITSLGALGAKVMTLMAPRIV